MSMISRYQKAGGFVQLLKLVETSGKQKQENFLNIIEKEDARWSAAIRQKMLSMEKIFSWSDNTLAEIFSRVNELTLGTALHGFTPEQWATISKTFSASQKRRIEDQKAAREPNAGEISAAYVKIIEDVRGMIADGAIKLATFAPDLVIPEKIEDQIMKGEMGAPAKTQVNEAEELFGASSSSAHAPHVGGNGVHHAHAPSHAAAGHGNSADHQKVLHLVNENNHLKNEVKVLKEKLAQIKKLSA